ncbi:hypothetical protein BLOT_008025 [Blomia tropicalis]|nr:hypothetical protein BLOT_008025 [Blomia tropicalis]
MFDKLVKRHKPSINQLCWLDIIVITFIYYNHHHQMVTKPYDLYTNNNNKKNKINILRMKSFKFYN